MLEYVHIAVYNILLGLSFSLLQPNDTVVSRNSLIALNVMVNDNSGAVIPDSLLPTVLPDPTSITNLTVSFLYTVACVHLLNTVIVSVHFIGVPKWLKRLFCFYKVSK